MKNGNAPEHPTKRPLLPIARATALAVTLALSLQSANAAKVTPPPVPTDLQLLPGHHAFLVGHAVGTQNYVCLPSGGGVKFVLFTPQATLFSDNDKQVTTHYFSPNPSQNGAIRATWEHSRDTSTVWGAVLLQTDMSSDSNFVAPGAIAWLKVTVVGAMDGPTGGDRLSGTTFIHRVNTVGGLAPPEGCTGPSDVGNVAFVPYAADYFFYTDR
jgi:hypothetical protein